MARVDFPVPGGNFNSRPCVRGDEVPLEECGLLGKFQFTPLREGRPFSPRNGCPFMLFQFTPLREGRPRKRCGLRVQSLFQFTPLREGRPLL